MNSVHDMRAKKLKWYANRAISCILAACFILLPLAGCSTQKTTSSPRITLVINEVVSGNSQSLVDSVAGSPDWIELYNPSASDVDLTGYRLTDKLDSKKGILANGTIKAGGYLIIYASKVSALSGSKMVCLDYNLPKGGENLYLVNAQNTVLCQIAVPALLTDESYARRSDGTYGFCLTSTPGRKNDDSSIVESSKIQQTLKSEALKLNEVLPKAASGEPWVELYNSGSSDIKLHNFYLSDAQNNPLKWHLPDSTLAAGKYAVVYLSGNDKDSPEMEASFKLGSQDTAVYLYDITGKLVGGLKWTTEIPVGISVVEGDQYTANPTKGAENSKDTFQSAKSNAMDSTDPVRINEVLPKNKYSIIDSDGDRCEWVELYNSSDGDVSLAGYFLSNNKDKLFKWAFPDTKIKAKGYLLVFLSGTQSKSNEIHASFRLSEGDAGVYLTKLNGMRVDTVALPATFGDNISVGRSSNGDLQYYAQPTPNAANAKGFADPALIGKFDKDGVYITEVSAASTVKSKANDWIEIHNGSDKTVDLTGYYLSDDTDKLEKWRIPSLQISANGYTVIEASSSSTKSTIANFGISPSGETLLLSNTTGNVIDAFATGVLSAGVTSGRIEGNNTVSRVFFTTSTRGTANAAKTLNGYSAMPVFSDTTLYHTSAFDLSITCTTENAKIYYTTDGSVPNSSSKVYSEPIPISKNTPVRAIAIAGGLLPSEVTTETYLFDQPHTVPVFCITGKPSEMNLVIKTNKMHYKPEFSSHVEYYEADGTPGVSFLSGLRPKGNLSLTFPQNSLIMALRSDYGQKSVTYPFFTGSKVNTFSQLALRDSGEDYKAARLRDSFFQEINKGLNVDSINTKVVVAYINGVYCGVYDLCEEQNDSYIKSYYGLDKNNIDMINHDAAAMSGDNKEFLRVSKLAQNSNLADDDVFAEFSKFVDVDACIDYLVAQIYFANGDVINQRMWRARDYSVKWRPLLFDLDFSMRYNNVNRNMFSAYFTPVPLNKPAPDNEGGDPVIIYPEVDNRIFCALRKNKAWCDKFVQRYIQLAETQYDTNRILGIYDELVKTMQPEMAQHIAKWHTPSSMSAWQSQTSILRNVIANRKEVALKQLQNYFNVSDATMQQYIAKYSNK